MFFSEKITAIKAGDRVLDIGPGSSPFPRADVLLERRYSTDDEYKRQCGDDGMFSLDPRVVFYDGGKLPFSDGEFDYVICSHVLEHVENVEEFCAEIFRVGKAGYFEYPLCYYEYLYDFEVHVSLLKWLGDCLVYLPKSEVFDGRTKVFRDFWFATLNAGYSDTVSQLVPLIMEGFEWRGSFEIRRCRDVSELAHQPIHVEVRKPVKVTWMSRVARRLKALTTNGG